MLLWEDELKKREVFFITSAHAAAADAVHEWITSVSTEAITILFIDMNSNYRRVQYNVKQRYINIQEAVF